MVQTSHSWDSLGAFRRGLWAAALFSLTLNLLMLTVPLYMTAIYDRVLSSRSIETLLALTLVAAGALAVAGLLETLRQNVLTRMGARLETTLGAPLYRATLACVNGGGSDVQGLRDMAQVRQFLSSPLMGALFDAPVAPIYVALLFLLHPDLGWITLGAALLILLISLLNQFMTRVPLQETGRQTLIALERAQSQVRNAEVVRSMGMTEACLGSWGEANAKGLVAADRAGRVNALLSGVTKTLRLLLQVAILGYGAFLVLSDHTISAGIIFAASIISARALAPLDQVVGGWRSYVASMQSWRRVRHLLVANPARPEPMVLPVPSPTLTVEKLVYLAQPGGEPIIKGVSFSIEPGEVVGIIGPSGAGKSTLARLLVGALRPTAGIVRIGGDDIQHWSADTLGPFIGYVPQDVELLPATVAQNIARMNSSPDPAIVVAAAQLANCHDLIQRLPGGYDTMLGAGGHVLSGGQRQRIALARAFFGTPRIVVLDEPNASLDGEGEQALINALHAASRAGMTCIVITQRTSIVPALTKMMVIRDGRLEAYGPKDEVIQQQLKGVPANGAPREAASGREAQDAGDQPGSPSQQEVA